ncbi:MAG TPA: ComF family protein [Dehalococcoidia bacterium]|nr:ComF family protein [Dehalococcoidia bacterium]
MTLDLLFPSRCLGCGKEGSLICAACRVTLPVISPPICHRCGKPQQDGSLCPACINHLHEIDGIRSPFRFEGIIRLAIHQFKYNNLRHIASSLSELLGIHLAKKPIPGEILMPVPLHYRRLRERGYNQSQLLAKELGKLTGLPVIAHCITRRRQAIPQAKAASINQRCSNVSDAFACHGNLKGKKVILIDDVATSGATLDACAAALKSAGAASVWGLTVAREV